MTSDTDALIVGGGIGGLAAALCLAKRGRRVRVFEQSARFTQAGAGIQLSPNCTRVLRDLGLETALRAHAFVPEGTQFRHWRRGHVIADVALGASVDAQYGAPYYHIHRGDLLSVLLDAARALPNITLHANTRAEAYSETDDGVVLETAAGPFRGKVLVGADGVRSTVRSMLWGAESPRFTGNVAWRMLVPADRLAAGSIAPVTTVWWGPGRHFVHYFVRSGQLVNCVCVVEKSGWEIESWTEPGAVQELRGDFTDWHADVQQLIDAADASSLYKWALFDREPMARWGRGRATLLGDACHATLPFMAQGAAMAIEDAAVLAGCIDQSSSIVSALNRYETVRRDRTAYVQRGSRRNARIFHLSGAMAWLRDRAAKRAPARAMHRLYAYDALDPSLYG